MTSRRDLLHLAFGGVAAAGLSAIMPRLATAAGAPVSPGVPAGVTASAVLDALPGKRPLIKLSYRPPNYETPLQYFNRCSRRTTRSSSAITLREFPRSTCGGWRLKVGGDAAERRSSSRWTSSSAGFDQAESSPSTSARATDAACSTRTCPASNGAMAPWATPAGRASRLKDVLAKAGRQEGGGRGGVRRRRRRRRRQDARTSSKSLPVWKALDESTLDRVRDERRAAAALERLSGAAGRARLDRHLLDEAPRPRSRCAREPFDGFWMKPAYRMPHGMFPLVDRFVSQETDHQHADHGDGGQLAGHQL